MTKISFLIVLEVRNKKNQGVRRAMLPPKPVGDDPALPLPASGGPRHLLDHGGKL